MTDAGVRGVEDAEPVVNFGIVGTGMGVVLCKGVVPPAFGPVALPLVAEVAPAAALLGGIGG